MSAAPGTVDPSAVFERAAMLVELGRNEEAKTLLLPLLGSDADQAETHFLLARSAWTSNLAESVHWAQAGLALAPDDGALLTILAHALIANQQHREALPVAGRAVELFPDVWQNHYAVAMALEHRGASEEAMSHMRTAQALAPDEEEIRLWFARQHIKAGRSSSRVERPALLREATQAADDALELAPDLAQAHAYRGILAYGGLDLRKTGHELSTAVQLDPQDTGIIASFGLILWGLTRGLLGLYGPLALILGILGLDRSVKLGTVLQVVMGLCALISVTRFVTLFAGASRIGRHELVRTVVRWPLVIAFPLGCAGLTAVVVGVFFHPWPEVLLPLGVAQLLVWIGLWFADRRGLDSREDGLSVVSVEQAERSDAV